MVYFFLFVTVSVTGILSLVRFGRKNSAAPGSMKVAVNQESLTAHTTSTPAHTTQFYLKIKVYDVITYQQYT